MFKIPRVNVIESDEGFSVEVKMTRLLYSEGLKRLYMSSEILVLQRDFILQRDFGYDNETLPLRRFESRWAN
jgi:hypothetical protein